MNIGTASKKFSGFPTGEQHVAERTTAATLLRCHTVPRGGGRGTGPECNSPSSRRQSPHHRPVDDGRRSVPHRTHQADRRLALPDGDRLIADLSSRHGDRRRDPSRRGGRLHAAFGDGPGNDGPCNPSRRAEAMPGEAMMGPIEIGICILVGTILFGGGVLRRRCRDLGLAISETRKIAGRLLDGETDDGRDDKTTSVR